MASVVAATEQPRGAIEFVDVTKAYGPTVAVDRVHLRIPAASYCCLLGPSGCGKSTSLRMLAGHEAATSGDILLDDLNVTDLPPARRRTAMMFQNYALFPHLSVIENVAFSLKMRGLGKAARLDEARAMLRVVEMERFALRLPTQLSGGQQQRVALARALITRPSALLLDEPLSALDPFLRLRVRAELKRLQQTLGISFVHVTHSQDEAMALADLVVLMNGGRIEQQGTAKQVFSRPRTAFVARFIGAHNVIDLGDREIAIRTDRIRLGNGHAGGDADGGYRNGAGPAGPAREATVRAVEFVGTGYAIQLVDDHGHDLAALVDESFPERQSIEAGQRVAVSWAPLDAHELEKAAS